MECDGKYRIINLTLRVRLLAEVLKRFNVLMYVYINFFIKNFMYVYIKFFYKKLKNKFYSYIFIKNETK